MKKLMYSVSLTAHDKDCRPLNLPVQWHVYARSVIDALRIAELELWALHGEGASISDARILYPEYKVLGVDNEHPDG